MTTQVFADPGSGAIFYIPETGQPDPTPYWNGFLLIGAATTRMEIIHHENAPNSKFMVFYGENDETLAIQMPEPVHINGTPKEEVLLGLRTVLPEEEISDLMTQLSEGMRRVEASDFTDHSNN